MCSVFRVRWLENCGFHQSICMDCTHFPSLFLTRLIKHTKQLLEENEERLCIKVLQTLREMMTKDRGYGEKVHTLCVPVFHDLIVVMPKIHQHMR